MIARLSFILALALPLAAHAQTFYPSLWGANSGVAALAPSAVLISSALLPALGTTDLGSAAHLVSDGWTVDVTLHATTDASPTFAHYAGLYQPSYTAPLAGMLPSPSSNFMHFTDTRPGYACVAGVGNGCTVGTVATTVYGTVPLRQPYGVSGSSTSFNNPITSTSGADLVVSLALSDPVFAGDSVGSVTFASGFYNYDGAHPSPAANVAPTQGVLPNYPPPIMSWVTTPGQYFAATAGFTVEVNCVAAAYGPTTGSQTCAGVAVTASDGTHSVTRTTNAMALSLSQVSATGTANNGSNVITGMASTDGFNLNDRVTIGGGGVPIPATIIAKTATSLTLGDNATADFTTGAPGTITLDAPASGNGQAFADGAYVGASISGANINAGISAATIQAAAGATRALINANLTYSGSNPKFVTKAVLTTNATATTLGSAQAVTINENYLGVTGTVTVYKGVPHYDYQVTFPAGDFSGTLTTKGNVSFEAKGYAQYGGNITDSALGAGAMNVPGTTPDGCDWFAVNVGSCTAPSQFAAAGTDVSPNFHNLWTNDDTSYSPVYCYVASTGTGTTEAATCNTTGIAPATGCTTTCAASPFVTLASVKAFNNARSPNPHNDLNGIVYSYISTGSPVTYAGFGGSISASITVKKPGVILTSVVSGGTATPYGTSQTDPVDVVLGFSSATNNTLGGTDYLNGITLSAASEALVGLDATAPTAFPVTEIVFNNDIFTPTSAAALLFRIGVWHMRNSQVNEGSFNADILSPSGSLTNSPGSVAYSTLVLGKYNAVPTGVWTSFNGWGNVAFNGGPSMATSTATASSFAQELSSFFADNRFINYAGGGIMQGQSPNVPVMNLALVNNQCEYVAGVSPCLYYSADGTFTPMYNNIDMLNSFIGARGNHDYQEGAPIADATALGTSGSLTNSTTYSYAVTLTNPGGAIEDAFDGPFGTIAVPAGAGAAGSITISLPPINLPGNPEGGARSAYFYLVSGSGSITTGSTTLATVTGCATQPCPVPAAGQSFVLTAVSATSRPLPALVSCVLPSPWVGWMGLKIRQIEQLNLRSEAPIKNDTYSFSGTCATTSWASGGRLGNWDSHYGVSKIGNVTVIGSLGGGGGLGTGPQGWTGMYTGWGSLPSVATGSALGGYGALIFLDDRSCGFSTTPSCGVVPTAAPVTVYGTDIGDGDYCLNHTSPGGLALVPSGYQRWPIDLYGVARLNNGNGSAGAIEGDDTGISGVTCH